MIYLRNTTDPQLVRIPLNGAAPGRVLTLHIVNTVDLGDGIGLEYDPKIYLIDAAGAQVYDADGAAITLPGPTELSHMYAPALVELPIGVTPGEYEYIASMDGEIVSVGLLIIGERRADSASYENPIEYEQYINN